MERLYVYRRRSASRPKEINLAFRDLREEQNEPCGLVAVEVPGPGRVIGPLMFRLFFHLMLLPVLNYSSFSVLAFSLVT